MTTKVSSKGQITIPIEIREQLGMLPDTDVECFIDGDALKVVKASAAARGRALVRHLTGPGTVKMTTDEIMALTRGED